MFYFLFGLTALISAYFLGKFTGRRELMYSVMGRGTWVEVVKPVKAVIQPGQPKGYLGAGTQGIITGISKWNEVSLFIAEPWAALDGIHRVYQIEQVTRLRIVPPDQVSESIREATLKKLSEDDALMGQVLGLILSAGASGKS